METKEKPIKVLIAKTGLDGHWRGVAVVCSALRDAGMEVIYGGQITAEEIASVAVQEDIDVLGLNIGGSCGTVQRIIEAIRRNGMEDVVVVGGGTFPVEDIPKLKEIGVTGLFPPGSRLDDIVSFIRENVGKKVVYRKG